MSKISRKDVEHVAKLAQLELSEEEYKRYTREFADILQYMEVINSIDTSAVGETSHVLNRETPLREDHVQPLLDPQGNWRDCLHLEEGFVKVPAVLKE